MFADAGEPCPDAIVVYVDAWTSLGGSQFLNSSATGRYLDYLCDEIVPFVDSRYRTAADRERRGIAGKSSGGYGAMVVPMLRPDTFGALASHAGDALFELCYLPEFPVAVRSLRDQFDGSIEVFLQELRSVDQFDYRRFGPLLNLYAMAAAYSPDPDRPGAVVLPVELPAGRLRATTCGKGGWGTTRSVWLPATPTRCDRCGGSTSTQAAPTNTSSTSGPRRSPRNSRSSGSTTASSFSTGATGASVTATRARSGSWSGRSMSGTPMAATADNDLAFAGVEALALMVRAREVSARELVELYLRRIEVLDPRLNAFRVTLAEEALAAADRLDAAARRTPARWPASRSPSRTTAPSPVSR